MREKVCPKCGRSYPASKPACPYCRRKSAPREDPLTELIGRLAAALRQHSSRLFLGGCALFLCIAVLGLIASQCHSEKETPAPPQDGTAGTDVQQPEEPADPLVLSETALSIFTGDTARLSASGGTTTVLWSSSAEDIASVAGGVITAKAAGTATITATCGEETAVCVVTVTEKAPEVELYLNHKDFTLRPNDPPVQMRAKVKETRKNYEGDVTWASSDTSIVTISETGLVERVGRGTTTITATVGQQVLECIVRVK